MTVLFSVIAIVDAVAAGVLFAPQHVLALVESEEMIFGRRLAVAVLFLSYVVVIIDRYLHSSTLHFLVFGTAFTVIVALSLRLGTALILLSRK